jgi:hypothetical protein
MAQKQLGIITAYGEWLDAGNTGTKQDFLNSLKSTVPGPQGIQGPMGPQGDPGDISGKLDKVTGGDTTRAYGVTHTGGQTMWQVSDSGNGGALARYCANGTLHVEDPSGGTDAASKGYVDRLVEEIELTPGPQGDAGPQGEQGPKGDPGDNGMPFIIDGAYATFTVAPQTGTAYHWVYIEDTGKVYPYDGNGDLQSAGFQFRGPAGA